MSTNTVQTSSGQEKETSATMRAVVADHYGPVDDLTLREIERPALEADRVLLRVHAASINPADLHAIKGGLIIRLTNGLRRPRKAVPGADVAGVVEAVGENVTDLRPGDEVYGTCAGSLAEYTLGGKNLVPKPEGFTFEQAASLPIAAITALQGLRDKAQLQPGQSVLINGASGGVGTFAVQIAKALGATVTGVCSAKNVEMVQSIGADEVVDYTRQDFSRSGKRFDVVFDLVGNRSLSDLRRVLTPDGTLVLSGGGHERGHGARGVLGPLKLIGQGLLASRFVRHKIVFYIASINKPDLLTLKELIEAGKIRPVIGRTYPLSEAAAAYRHLEGGHATGKIVITV